MSCTYRRPPSDLNSRTRLIARAKLAPVSFAPLLKRKPRRNANVYFFPSFETMG